MDDFPSASFNLKREMEWRWMRWVKRCLHQHRMQLERKTFTADLRRKKCNFRKIEKKFSNGFDGSLQSHLKCLEGNSKTCWINFIVGSASIQSSEIFQFSWQAFRRLCHPHVNNMMPAIIARKISAMNMNTQKLMEISFSCPRTILKQSSTIHICVNARVPLCPQSQRSQSLVWFKLR